VKARVLGAVVVALVSVGALWWLLPGDPLVTTKTPGRAAPRVAPRVHTEALPPERNVDPPPPSPERPPAEGKPVPDAVRKMLVDDAAADEPMVDPGISVWPLNRDGIQGAVDEVLPRLQGCYDEALEEVPDLEGQLTVAFTVVAEDGIGQVWAARIEDDRLDDGPVADCVLDAMEALQFDPPDEGELVVTYPFRFEAHD